jgi:hypothetical protein
MKEGQYRRKEDQDRKEGQVKGGGRCMTGGGRGMTGGGRGMTGGGKAKIGG